MHKLTIDEGGQAAEFYVVGTAHVSRASCDDVAAAIQALRPQVGEKRGGRERGRGVWGG